MSFAGSSVSSCLDHPLFSESLSAAQYGEFSTAFKGIAALIDDEEQEAASGSPIKPRSMRPTSVPLCPTLEFAHSLPSMHNALAASSGSNTPIVWTRPSAIRLAKQRASAQMQLMSSARKPRAAPYDRANGASAEAAVSLFAGVAASPASPSAPVVAASAALSSDYRPVRHERRRGFKPASSSAAAAASARSLSLSDGLLPVAPRRSRSGGSPSDSSGGSMHDENDVESRAANISTLELADTHSSGEATMLLKMWKM